MRHNLIAATFIDPPFFATYIRASCCLPRRGPVRNCVPFPHPNAFPHANAGREDDMRLLRPRKRPDGALLPGLW